MPDFTYDPSAGFAYSGLDPAPPATLGTLRDAPAMPTDAWIGALLEQLAETLDDPAIRPKVIAGLKRVLPGRVLDRFAGMILDAVVKAMRSL